MDEKKEFDISSKSNRTGSGENGDNKSDKGGSGGLDFEKSVRLVQKGDFALLELDFVGKSFNVLTSGLLNLFKKRLEEIERSSFKAVILISRKRNIFVAGADISEIQKINSREKFEVLLIKAHEFISGLEDLKIPVIAAIHGACLGGGLELALACSHRIATSSPLTRIGLPEVRLGIIPGFGGCVRLPKLIGLRSSLDIILNGKSVDGRKALKMGLVDECVLESELEERAFKLARKLRDHLSDEAKKKKKGNILSASKRKRFRPKSLVGQLLETYLGRKIVFLMAKRAVYRQTKGFYPAPLKALDVVRRTYTSLNRKRNLEIEARGFLDVVMTEVSRYLIELFFSMEGVKKKFLSQSFRRVRKKVKRVGILGAGTMGGGIAYAMANRGFPAQVKDISDEALVLAYDTAYKIWEKKVKRKKLSLMDLERKVSLISGGVGYEVLRNADFVIEAVVENMEVKKQVISDCVKFLGEDIVVATNTSSLSVTEMAEAHPAPENFIGMHFFNPVDRMPLVEIIRGSKTSDETVAKTYYLAKQIGKTPIVVKDGPGFLVNRLLLPYMIEALFLVRDGMDIQTVDFYYTHKFGMPMGPLRLLDEVGLDVAYKVLKIFQEAMKDRIESPPYLEAIFSSNRLGKKSGRGFYLYDSKGKEKSVDQSIYKDLNLKPSRKALSQKECLERGVFLMINEASRALDEQIVENASDLDLAMIFGTGFPPFRGGLLKYADHVGIKNIVESLRSYFALYKRKIFIPSKSLSQMAKENKRFYS